jgi:hypothetical protein
MPSIHNLTLTVTGGTWSDVTLEVTYTAFFSQLELFLASNGLRFSERVQIIGDDPGDAGDKVLHTLQSQTIEAKAWGVPRTRTLTVNGRTLDEDPATTSYTGSWGSTWSTYRPDPDELFARVELTYAGLGPELLRSDSAVVTLG